MNTKLGFYEYRQQYNDITTNLSLTYFSVAVLI